MLGAPASSLVTDSVKKKKMAPGACQGLEGSFFFFFAWSGNRFVRGCPDPPQRLREAPRPHALTGRELSPSLVPCELYGFSLEMAIWSKVEESGKLLDPEENHTPSAEGFPCRLPPWAVALTLPHLPLRGQRRKIRSLQGTLDIRATGFFFSLCNAPVCDV